MKPSDEIKQAASRLAHFGASKGGRTRASTLTPEERSEIARQAVMARWKRQGKLKKAVADELPPKEIESHLAAAAPPVPYSMFRGELPIGETKVECHVLNDLKRVITQREVVRILSGGRDSGNLKAYLERNELIHSDNVLGQQIRFTVPGIPTPASGIEGTLLIEICDAYLRARDQKFLQKNQLHLAQNAEIVMRSCAKVGIIALIDEATGYQEVRAKNALRLKLEAFIAEDMQEWARMFPNEFWMELARLEGVTHSPRTRPLRWGKYVMAFVYDAIDKDVGKKLRQINPNPRYQQNHHQWLKQYGKDQVIVQIQRVITIMKLCNDMDEFRQKFAHVFKREPLQLRFEDLALAN